MFRARWICLLGPCALASTLYAADTNTPAPLTPQEMFEGGNKTYNNWVDLSAGGFLTSGNKGQFSQSQQSVAGPFGGISDFHYQRDLDKTTTFTADGHALFDQEDYKLVLGVTREKVGYVRFSYNEFRTWYNGDGGFNPPSDLFFRLPGNGLSLDRGEVSFEAGYRPEKGPKVTLKYTHSFRDGDKSSTSWGITHPAVGVTQGLSPSFYNIKERSDTIELDGSYHIKATEVGLGLRYETGTIDNALKINQDPGDPLERKITDRQGTTYDLVSVHAFTETWIKKNLLFTSGYSFSDLWNDLSGSRIYGSDFDVRYSPNDLNGFGYTGLDGSSGAREYVLNLNLMDKPTPQFSIVPSLRVQKEDLDAHVTGMETFMSDTPVPFSANSDRSQIEVRERLNFRYTGVTNWVFNGCGEWTEGQGELTQNGGLGPMDFLGVPTGVPPVQAETDDSRFFQKYSADIRWYPTRKVTADVGGYYKLHEYDYNNEVDSTPNNGPDRYPAYLVMQSFETYDGNAGVTLKPWMNVTLVSRYEYQWSTIHTKPDPISGLGDAESAKMTSHIFAENVSWVPWSRLSLQAGFNYVLSQLHTPVSDFTPAVLLAQNNYWTLNFSSSLVVDNKTDLNLGYFYYRADDYHNNSAFGVPYGSGAEEHGLTAGLVRRISKNVRLSLKYGYYHYTDQLAGGNNDYNAHVLFSSMQYRF